MIEDCQELQDVNILYSLIKQEMIIINNNYNSKYGQHTEDRCNINLRIMYCLLHKTLLSRVIHNSSQHSCT